MSKRVIEVCNYYLEHGRKETSQHFGLSVRTIEDYIYKGKNSGILTEEQVADVDSKFGLLNRAMRQNKVGSGSGLLNSNSIKMGVSLKDFRAKNDPKVIISEGLKKLTKEKLYKTSEFKQLIGLPMNISSRELEEMGELERYHGKCSGVVYWSDPEVIEQLKNEMILR